MATMTPPVMLPRAFHRRSLTCLRIALVATMTTLALFGAEGEVIVKEVELRGLKENDPGRVRAMLLVRSGRTYSVDQLTQNSSTDLRALETLGPFTGTVVQVVPVAGGVKVVYTTTELAYVSAVDLVGENLTFKEDSLRKLLTTKRGGYLNPLLLESDRQALLRKLQDDGFRRATVATQVRDQGPFTAVTFQIELGEPVMVGRVALKNLPTGVRPWMFEQLLNRQDAPWQPDLIDFDRSMVVRILIEQGYLDAKLRSTTIEWNDLVFPVEDRRNHGPRLVPDGVRNDRVVVVYDIEPGIRYRLGDVAFVGTTLASQDQLRSGFTRRDVWGDQVTMASGEPYVKRILDGALDKSVKVITDQGYARCGSTVNARKRPGTDLVDLTVTINPGKKYTIGRLDIDGNEVTRDGVIRRALAVAPGELWNGTRVTESERQIQRTGLFDGQNRRVRLERSFPDDRPDQVDISVRTTEKETGRFGFQLGYSGISGLFTQVTYREDNFDLLNFIDKGYHSFRGGGQTLEATVNVAQQSQSIGLTHSEPALFDGPYSITTSGRLDKSSTRDWDEKRSSIQLILGRSFLSNDLRVTAGYRYTDLKIENPDLDAPDDVVETKAFQNSVLFGQEYDRLNDRRTPTAGWTARLNEEVAGRPLPASAPLFEYSARAEGYLPVFENEDGGVTFLRAAARWQHKLPIAGENELPFYERIGGGGPAPRHRGFDVNREGPKEINANGFTTYPGGNRELLLTLEWTVPLTGGNEGLRGVIFADAGNVWGEDQAMQLSEIRTAVGVGIRMPAQLPIALDLAWLLDRRSDESAFQFHFGVAITRF